LFAATEG